VQSEVDPTGNDSASGQSSPREATVPPGLYRAKFLNLFEAEHPKLGPVLRFVFEIVEGEHQGSQVMRVTEHELVPDSNGGRILSGLLGISLEPSQKYDVSSHVGSEYLVHIVPRPSGEGTLLGAVTPVPESADRHWADIVRGESFFAEGRYEDALDVFVQILDRAPDNVAALNDAGLASANLDRVPDAAQYFEKALSFEPGNENAFFNLLELFIRADDPDSLKQAYNKYESSIPASPDKDRWCDRLFGPEE